MTSTEIKTIKPTEPTGGDNYATLAEWDSAEKGNLVTQDKIKIAEVYGGGNCLGSLTTVYTAGAWTTDTGHYVEIRAAPGHQHSGVYDTNKAYAEYSGLSGSFFNVTAIRYLKLTGMQIKSNVNSASAAVLYSAVASGTSERTINKCIFIKTGSFSGNMIYLNRCNPFTIKNCIILHIGGTSGGEFVFADGSGVDGTTVGYIYNCTCIGTAGLNDSISASNSTITTENCYFKTPNGSTYQTAGTGVVNHGAKDATSGTDATDPTLRNVPYTTATFLNVTAGSENLRPFARGKTRNILLYNGVDLTSSGVTTDIIGTPRFGKFDIGAFENRDTRFFELF